METNKNIIAIDKTLRINRRILSNEKQAIIDRHMAAANIELKDIKEQWDKNFNEEVEFCKKVTDILTNVKYKQKANIKTQVGPNGGETINDYPNATIESVSIINYKVNVFNVTHPDAYEGKPFSIGLSCLLSIELID